MLLALEAMPIDLAPRPTLASSCGYVKLLPGARLSRVNPLGRLKVSHKADCAALQGCCFRLDCSSLLSKLASPSDLIGFLQSLPEGRKRRSVRYLQWLLLLLAILGILSGCRSARDLERFARRHRVDAGPNRRAGQGT